MPRVSCGRWAGARSAAHSALTKNSGTRACSRLGENLYGPGFANGAALVIRAMLQSPLFLYRSELGPSGQPLDAYEVASKLSFGLLGTTPSDDLLDLAAGGVLDDAAGIESNARAMLEAPAAVAVMRDFHGQLYQLSGLRHPGPFAGDPRAERRAGRGGVSFLRRRLRRWRGCAGDPDLAACLRRAGARGALRHHSRPGGARRAHLGRAPRGLLHAGSLPFPVRHRERSGLDPSRGNHTSGTCCARPCSPLRGPCRRRYRRPGLARRIGSVSRRRRPTAARATPSTSVRSGSHSRGTMASAAPARPITAAPS